MTTEHKRNVLVSLILIGIVALVVGIIIGRRVTASDSITGEELRNYARLASFEYKIVIEQSRAMLDLISRLPEVESGDKEGCRKILGDLEQASSPRYIGFGIASPDGTVWCSSGSTSLINISDRLYFKKSIEEKTFFVGNYIIGRVSSKPNIPFALPTLDPSGNVVRVATLGLDLSWIKEFTQLADLPSGATITLVDNKGILLAQYPEDEKQGEEAIQITYKPEQLDYIERYLAQVKVKNKAGEEYHLIAVPLRRDNQEGVIHMIITIPVDEVLN